MIKCKSCGVKLLATEAMVLAWFKVPAGAVTAWYCGCDRRDHVQLFEITATGEIEHITITGEVEV
jgi:hypothetical protein